ncbi:MULTISPECIES: hypothetical protein [Chryseobacterium]|uniref:Uncharacterized protein n=1 Tax=Candidatus Chryseobacterium massiliense TaxID=204089 RepID=A0A3D9BGJ3_9FLAO|nr:MULTISPECIES: hypothetical protein [Chryseobacterium]REC52634.1 hypothetical protein DRF68_02605 [Candidatus Chryseobacterium massiliae]
MSEIKYGRKFFDYDEIDYYQIEIEMEDAANIYKFKKRSNIDNLRYQVICNNIPKNIDDLDFLNFMNEIGYRKQSINTSNFSSVDKIFVEKPAGERMAAGCIAVFRDILIFKKNKLVTGIAKICFSCHKYQLVGTEAQTENFGSNDDYSKLAGILYNTEINL